MSGADSVSYQTSQLYPHSSNGGAALVMLQSMYSHLPLKLIVSSNAKLTDCRQTTRKLAKIIFEQHKCIRYISADSSWTSRSIFFTVLLSNAKLTALLVSSSNVHVWRAQTPIWRVREQSADSPWASSQTVSELFPSVSIGYYEIWLYEHVF